MTTNYHGYETLSTIAEWCEETFGPCSIPRQIERADDEFEELLDSLRDGSTQKEIAIEAADVIICLSRIPGLEEAIQEKMKINRERKWKLNGDGTAKHIKDV